jgi:DNA damage-binding protein 1
VSQLANEQKALADRIVLASLPLGLREEVSCLSEVLLNEHHYIAVGTALLPEDEDVDLVYEENASPAKEGRLLLLDPVHDRSTSTWTLEISAELKTVGAVNDITVIHEFLAYAAASKVSIMKFEDDVLTELSNFSSTFIAHSLFTAPPSKYQAEEKLIVGDGMRSVLMLEVDDESGMIYGDDRDMATHQVVALAGIKDRGQGVVVADVSCCRYRTLI